MTETSSRPELTDDDTLLKCWVLNLKPPRKNADPSTSSRFDNTDPSSDTCTRGDADDKWQVRHQQPL